MSGVVYKVGRRPYVVSKFVETGDGVELTVPFLVTHGEPCASSHKNNADIYGGKGLYRQVLKMPEGKINISITEKGVSATAFLKGDQVTRFRSSKAFSDLDDHDIYIAKFYDCRVGIGAFKHYIMELHMTVQRTENGIDVHGELKHALPTEKEGLDNVQTQSDAGFSLDMYTIEVGVGKWQNFFNGYNLTSFEWCRPPVIIDTLGRTKDESNSQGFSSVARKFNVYERKFTATFVKKVRKTKSGD